MLYIFVNFKKIKDKTFAFIKTVSIHDLMDTFEYSLLLENK